MAPPKPPRSRPKAKLSPAASRPKAKRAPVKAPAGSGDGPDAPAQAAAAGTSAEPGKGAEEREGFFAKHGHHLAGNVLALVAIVFTAVTFLRSGDQEQRAEAADRRALADQVVLTVFDEPKHVEPKNRGPDTPDLKPVPVFTYVVANFGSLPVLDVRLRGSSYLLDLAGEKLRFHDVMDLGTIGPCQVATITNLDLSDPSVEFADANGRRWSRKPAKQPAKVKPPSQAAQGREVVSHGRLAVKELRHCQA